MRYIVAAIAFAASTSAAFGQTTASTQVTATPAPAPMLVGGQPDSTVIRAGTRVLLKTVTPLTTKGKHLKEGDKFSLEVAEPVLINGHTVIPVGSSAVGEVTSVRNKGMWGKSGNIETRLLYVMANDRRIRLTGSVGDKGVKAGGGAIAASALVFLPAGFFMTGTSAVIPIGTQVAGIIDEDIPVAFAPSAPATMTVQQSQPAVIQTVATAPAAAK